MHQRSAFTLIEFTTVVVIVAIITIAAMPDPDTEARQQGEMAANSFEAMVAFGRSLAVTQPDKRVVVKVDAATNCFWVSQEGAEDTPVVHPLTKRPFKVQVGPGTRLNRVTLYAADFNGDTKFRIDGQGCLDQATPAVLQLQVDSKQLEISVNTTASDSKVTESFTKVLAPLDTGQGTQSLSL